LVLYLCVWQEVTEEGGQQIEARCSNHIHLLVVDDGDREVIPSSVQLVAGRTGQEYNERKDRKGAYWEDRFHATAVETGDHLARCNLSW
jgi:putative transposase